MKPLVYQSLCKIFSNNPPIKIQSIDYTGLVLCMTELNCALLQRDNKFKADRFVDEINVKINMKLWFVLPPRSTFRRNDRKHATLFITFGSCEAPGAAS
jgi:hypothetical protein